MSDVVNTNNIDNQELDYLYALYKVSQSGRGIKLTKMQLKKLIESGLLKQNPKHIEEIELINQLPAKIKLGIPKAPSMFGVIYSTS